MEIRHCADCRHRASAQARFCERCGTPLTATAAPLRAPSGLEARILEQRTAIEGEHKQVTVLYADIVGSMQLTHVLESERWGFVLDRFLAIAAAAVHAFEGTVNQFTGDGLMAVFGAPLAHEDHARRACLAALELQQQVATLAAELTRTDGVEFAVRCGLNSGPVVVGAIGDDVHMDFVPLGNTTALGRRIESLAPPGSTAIGPSTAALVDGEFEVRELGEFVVKGAADRLRVRELVGPGPARTRLQAVAATRGLSRFVGRAAERAVLDSALQDVVSGSGRAITLVGDPGVGKSRLVHEFVAECLARGLPVASTSGIAHGRDVPLLPVLALARDFFGVDGLLPPGIVLERIAAMLLPLDPAFAAEMPLLSEFLGVADPDRPLAPSTPQELDGRLPDLLARAVAIRGRHEPTVLVVEDVHWLDDASAAVIEALVAAVADSRTLLVATSRPGRPLPWTVGPTHDRIDLGPLEPDAADELLAQLVGRDGSLDGLGPKIGARAQGNPFFIEELVQALVECGHLAGTRGALRLASELDGVVLPATVQAGLAARIDRLAPHEKLVMQTMAVIGDEIPAPLLSAVTDLEERELAEAVAMLADAQYVVPHDVAGDPRYLFRHPLTREVAYGSQLSEHRAHTHQRVAAAIEHVYPEDLDERAALVAHHCEAAGDTLEAARWHVRAASWSERASLAAGLRHWRRVRDLTGRLEEATPDRDALASRARSGILGLVWRIGGDAAETATIREEARTEGGQAIPELFAAGTLMHGAREVEGLEGFREAARRSFAAGDSGGALTASTGVAYASWIAGSLPEGIATIDRALALAGGDPAVGAAQPYACPLAHAYGQRALCRGYAGDLGHARRDFARAIDLARAREDPITLSAAHANFTLVEAVAGDTEVARRQAALGLEVSERLGDLVHSVACEVPLAAAEAREGRFADALARARSNLDTVRRSGVGRYYEPLLLATIARCRLGLGEADGALAAAEQGADIAAGRALAACALHAPLALAHVLLATRGAAAGERVEAVLGRARLVVGESGARLFESGIDGELRELERHRAGEVEVRAKGPTISVRASSGALTFSTPPWGRPRSPPSR